MTPIASLQNVLALSALEHAGIEITFGSWIMFAVPFCVVCVLLCWLILMICFNTDDVKEIPLIVHTRTASVGKKKEVSSC